MCYINSVLHCIYTC